MLPSIRGEIQVMNLKSIKSATLARNKKKNVDNF